MARLARRDHLGQLRTISRLQADRELLWTMHDINSLWSSIKQRSGPQKAMTFKATRY